MTNVHPVLRCLLGIMLLTACGTQSQKVVIPELDLAFDADTIHMSQEAERYIETAVDLMRENALYKKEIDFEQVHQAIRFYADGAKVVSDTHSAIDKALPLLKDHHSGWIIDVRDNDGGADMPMIAGLGPLLDEENSYYGIDESGTVRTKSYYQNGTYYNLETQTDSSATPIVRTTTNYELSNPGLPVVVLTSRKTASSAEAVVAIFQGQENVTVVGEKTNGLTTVNSFNFLEDNAVLNLTMAHYANRDKKLFIQGIPPDIEVAPSEESDSDVVMQKALELLATK